MPHAAQRTVSNEGATISYIYVVDQFLVPMETAQNCPKLPQITSHRNFKNGFSQEPFDLFFSKSLYEHVKP